jgi:hypothetical protein
VLGLIADGVEGKCQQIECDEQGGEVFSKPREALARWQAAKGR